MRYSKFPCADHSNEPLKAEIVFARGLHDSLSFISIAQGNLEYLICASHPRQLLSHQIMISCFLELRLE